MPDLTITIAVNGADAHVCGGMCDCPAAITRAQEAIDADRAQHGRPPRTLLGRLIGMRHGRPGPEWFASVAQQARQLEADAAAGLAAVARATPGQEAAAWAARCEASDAASPTERLAALQAAVEETVKLLERGDVIPFDHEYVHDPSSGESRVYAGNLQFTAGMTGSSDTPAAHYVVTTSDEAGDTDPAERFTTDLNQVRAWLIAWSAFATYR